MVEEDWKEIDGHEMYQVSNRGQIKSLKFGKEIIMKPRINRSGYLQICLRNNGKAYYKTIHSIVWDAFGDKPRNGRKLQVDHINNDKTDNRIENLQLLDARANISKAWKQKEKSGKETGAHWDKSKNKWSSHININGKNTYIGVFTSESEAAQAYQDALKKIKSQSPKGN